MSVKLKWGVAKGRPSLKWGRGPLVPLLPPLLLKLRISWSNWLS